MNFEIEKGKESKSFDRIAKIIFNDLVIEVNDHPIELCDIEFYWNDKGEHQDGTTHFHQYESGQLRPHRNGFDIALNSTNGEYGGILVRGVKSGDEVVSGPLKSADLIFRFGQSLFTEDGLKIHLKNKYQVSDVKHFSTKRLNLGKIGKEYHNQDYRFIKLDFAYLKKLPGKEAIAKKLVKEGKLEMESAISDIIGYTPKDWKSKS